VFNERTINLFRYQRVLTVAAVHLITVFPQGISLVNRGVFKKEIPTDNELFAHISEQTSVSEIVDMSYVHRRVIKVVVAETVTMYLEI